MHRKIINQLLALQEEDELRAQIDDWVKRGIVKIGTSEYASPLVVSRREDGRARVCIDYKKLNKVVEKQHFSAPVIEDVLDAMPDVKTCSVVDLTDGFFQVDVATKVMFGYCDSPASFLELIDFMFRELLRKGVIAKYMDDLGINAKNKEQAVECLAVVLDLAESYGIKINWKKVNLSNGELDFWGIRSKMARLVLRRVKPRLWQTIQYLIHQSNFYDILDWPAIFESLFAIIH